MKIHMQNSLEQKYDLIFLPRRAFQKTIKRIFCIVSQLAGRLEFFSRLFRCFWVDRHLEDVILTSKVFYFKSSSECGKWIFGNFQGSIILFHEKEIPIMDLSISNRGETPKKKRQFM